jgi:hypothetical protein
MLSLREGGHASRGSFYCTARGRKQDRARGDRDPVRRISAIRIKEARIIIRDRSPAVPGSPQHTATCPDCAPHIAPERLRPQSVRSVHNDSRQAINGRKAQREALAPPFARGANQEPRRTIGIAFPNLTGAFNPTGRPQARPRRCVSVAGRLNVIRPAAAPAM